MSFVTRPLGLLVAVVNLAVAVAFAVALVVDMCRWEDS